MALSARKPAIPALTGVRFLAALSVALFHLSFQLAASLNIPTGHFFDNAGEPVELFFMLSGFILTYTHSDVSTVNRAATSQFYLSRFAKIYPMYLLGWLVFAPLIYINLVSLHGPGPGTYARLAFYGVMSITLMQAWIPATANAWNTPGWSLSAEAFFYALFPLLFASLKHRTVRALIALIALCWLISVVPTIVVSMLPKPFSTVQWPQDAANFMPVLRIAEFIAGICMGRLYLDRSSERSWAFDLAAALALVLAVAAMLFSNYLHARVVLFPVFFALLYCLARASGPLSRLLGSKVMVLLGEASFAFYILHVPLFKYAKIAVPSVATSPLQFSIFLVALTGVSIFCYLSIEKPLCAYLRRAYRTPPVARVPATLQR
ncbi:acyltransferase family protein [Caballeronia sp.]|uniref:acyltransferase family protein n=1 Tax=Caballeronia sp. TaxID=1931223 RepID=UPI003C699B2F